MDQLRDRGHRIAIAIAVAAVGVRLIQLTEPFIDPWSWRQSDVGAIARNFSEGGFHFAYPQIDWAGNELGYVGTEFPLLPFAAALSYKFLGVHEWIGRLESVLFFAASLPFFYLLVRRIFDESAALWGLFFYCVAPVCIVTSRAFMPDIPSLALSLAGLYFYLRWLEENKVRSLLCASLLIGVSLLTKLPSTTIGAPLLYLSWERRGIAILRRPAFWCFGAIVLLPAVAWYWHAYRTAQTYYPHHFFGGGGLQIENPEWYGKILAQTVTSTLTPLLSALALAGFFLFDRRKYRHVFHWWLAAMILFICVVGWGNRHQWYQLPLVPIAAALAGRACSRLQTLFFTQPLRRIAFVMFIVISVSGLSFAYAGDYYVPVAASARDLGLELERKTAPTDLIIAADNGDPTVFYYAHRKGWHFLEEGIYEGNPWDSVQAIQNLEKLRNRGADCMVFDKSTMWWLDYYKEFAAHLSKTAKLVERNPQFIIYRLDPSKT